MLELELMHFYITETGPSIPFDHDSSHDLFVKAIPRMATRSDALLYAIYSFVTLHQIKTTGGEQPSIPSPAALEAARENHQRYLGLAFREHHRELGQLSRLNADVVCMTSNFMRLNAFVMLSERNLDPYAPPLEWLRITSSHARIFRAAWDLVGDDGTTQVARLVRSTPVAWDVYEREGADKRRDFQHVLLPRPRRVDMGSEAEPGSSGTGHDEDDSAAWDVGVRQAYEKTLSYIGGIWQAVQNHEPPGPIRRRLIVFPLLIDKRFIELVAECRPRALVILAHYFALVSLLQSFWFVGKTGSREVHALAKYLPADWQDLMEWPLWFIDQGLR